MRLTHAYWTSSGKAGMVPVIVPPVEDANDARQILDAVHGLVLSGGEDVDPALYGASRHATASCLGKVSG